MAEKIANEELLPYFSFLGNTNWIPNKQLTPEVFINNQNVTSFGILVILPNNQNYYVSKIMSNHKFSAFAPRPTFMSPASSVTRSPENETFYKSEINSVTITPNSQLRTQIHF